MSQRLLLVLLLSAPHLLATPTPMPFGSGGQVKMLYDSRQRPQSVYLNGKVHVVFNGGGDAGAGGVAPTKPMAITYDPKTQQFSKIVTLGPENLDHHFGPVIWADSEDRLHVLYGCHNTPGVHLISKKPGSIGDGLDAWEVGPTIAPGISYPTVFRVYRGRELIYYRAGGHSGSWTYRLSADNGRTWSGPASDVTDEDQGGALAGKKEWSSYQSKLPSADGRFLHVAFIAYDDNTANDPQRALNPRYKQVIQKKGNSIADWKYNLYYVKIDLQSQAVTNFDGEPLKTPIDINQADATCRIWDTDWRGSGVPPAIMLDRNGDPAFLHVLSEESLHDHRYYYVRRSGGRWIQSPITHSNHNWNCGHLARDGRGVLHAYLITGDGYFDGTGQMDKYGGGSVEEWVSTDDGYSWSRRRDLTPDRSKYPGWKFNNIQAVTKPDGTPVQGMLLFYGWKHAEAPDAVGFLLHEEVEPQTPPPGSRKS